MACNPESLINLASCLTCLSEKQLMAINAYLLCQILSNGGTGGSGTSSGAGAPTVATTGVLYFDTTADNLWANTPTGWIMLL